MSSIHHGGFSSSSEEHEGQGSAGVHQPARPAASAPLELRVLGTLEVGVGGRVVDIGGARQRRLLSVLVANVGEVVAADALAEAVWDDDDRPTKARDAVRTYVSRLRRSLADAGLDAERLLVTQPPGYRLAVPPEWIDGARFGSLVGHGRSLLEGGDAAGALDAFDRAVALWRGDPYAEFDDRPWTEPAVASLGELRIVATEERAAARLDLGAHAEVVGELEHLVREHPLRARPAELLAVALARSGRQADALRALDRLRGDLADVGLDLPSDLIELERRIATADPSLHEARPPPSTIRGYEVIDQIGEGAFAVVFRAVQPALGREVALKQIRAELADLPDFVRRFEIEARTVASLEHPFIVPLHDFWREPGAAFVVMRWLRGGTLADTLESRRYHLGEAQVLATQVGGALSAAHGAGIVHRDVTAANVFLDEDGNHYLGDFGIAVDVGTTDPDDLRWTGSPQYVSPEQLDHRPVGPASDLYSLGVVLWQSLTGELPFPSGSPTAELRVRKLDEPLPSVHRLRPDVPAAVDDVLWRATAVDPAERFASADELTEAFVSACGGDPPAVSEAAAARTGTDQANPYKGLRAFHEGDADDFFGRERLTARLVEAFAVDGRLVAVVGPSGSGKSSVVRAGLVSRLRAGAVDGSERWVVTTMLPTASPFVELGRALRRVATGDTDPATMDLGAPGGIGRAIARTAAGAGSDVLLVIDQFEELYTLAGEADRRAFLDGLHAALLEPAGRLRLVLTVRADFWDRPLRHAGLARLLETAAVTVPPLSSDELAAAVARPAARAGVDVEPELLARIVADLSDEPAALPLLQHVLFELFEQRTGPTIALGAYEHLGGLDGALARRAEAELDALSAAGRAGARSVLTRLVTPGEGTADGRRRVRRSELDGVESGAEVIDRFGDARLLTFDRDPETREPTVEVAHEALLRAWPRLRAWLDEDREALHALHRLRTAAADWDADGRPDSELYRGGRLDLAVDLLADDLVLAPVERQFVATGVAQREAEEAAAHRELRRLRRQRTATAVVAVVALVAGVLAVGQARRADQSAAEADEQRAAAESLATAEAAARRDADVERMVALAGDHATTDPTLAFLLAREAYERRPDHLTRGGLLSTLQRDDGYLGSISTSTANANNQWIGWLDDDTLIVRRTEAIDVYDVRDRVLVATHRSPARYIAAPWADSRDGLFATVTTDDGGGVVVIPSATRQPQVVDTSEREHPAGVSIGADGSLVVGYESGLVEIRRGDGWTQVEVAARHDGPAHFTAMSDDGRLVAAAAWGGSRSLWEIDADRQTRLRWRTGGGLDSGLLRFGPDGTTLYSLHISVAAVDVEDGSVRWHSPGGGYGQFDLLPDGAVAWNGDLVRDGALVGSLVPGASRVGARARAVISPDGRVVATHGSAIRLWSRTGDQLIARAVERRATTAATVSARGTHVAAVETPLLAPSPRVVDTRTGEEVSTDLSGPISFVPSGAVVGWAADAGGDLGLGVLSPDGFGERGTVIPDRPFGFFGGVDVHLDRGLLAVGSTSETRVSVHDLRTGELVAELGADVPVERRTHGTYVVDFSPAGSLLVATIFDAAVVWDTTSWEIIRTVEPPGSGSYFDAAVSADDRLLAAGRDAAVDIYDLATGDVVTSVEGPTPLALFMTNGLSFTGDGRYLLAGGPQPALIDIAAGRIVGSIFPDAGHLGTASVGAGGDHLVTSTDEHLLVWEIDPESWPEIVCRAAGRNMTPSEWEQFGPRGEPYRATCPQWPVPA